jgi:hypothetical protein
MTKLYLGPQVDVMDILPEGVLCESLGSGTDDLQPGDSWEGLL